MLFNSFAFLLFFPTVFLLYWLVLRRSLRMQNAFLLAASYVFYGWWDWRFVFLLAFSTALDYLSAIRIERATNNSAKRIWLVLSVVINLGFLAFFKYYNFFIESMVTALEGIGVSTNVWTLRIILPVGISFYTFHGLSYIFDVYYGRAKARQNIVDYSLFVAFFPLLVAGPIERATHLLPQIETARLFQYEKVVDGARQILWGLFKKILVGDTCGYFVNMIFNNPGDFGAGDLLMGAVLFSFQIYADFSGYSDIALGTARMLGFDLLRNFAYPYFSRDIAEFWRRWHISLTSWFRDYVYIPLGGSRGPLIIAIRNTFVIFLISGLWHGANWTFVLWGLVHALLFIPLLLQGRNRLNMRTAAEGRILPTAREFFKILSTFAIVTLAWIFFRSSNVEQATDYFKRLFNIDLFSLPTVGSTAVPFIVLLVVAEWFQRGKTHGLQIDFVKPRAVRWSVYISLAMLIFVFGGEQQDFIYFQF